jgi:hypothetical protein
MARVTNAELQRRIEELEAENGALRVQVVELPAAQSGPPPAKTSVKDLTGRSWGWTFLATALIVIGALLAPVAIVAAWAKIDLTDTDRFVATYAPLAKNPAVQAYITTETVDAINKHVNIDKITSNVIDGITGLGTGPLATKALDSLKGPAAAGLKTLVQNKVSAFVHSNAFDTVWTDALHVSHKQFVEAMQNNSNAAIKLGSDGSIGIQLGPIVAAAKKALVKDGVSFASKIPAVNRTIVVAQSDAVPTVQLVYNLAVGAGSWLPWFVLLFLAAGVIVARRRALALVWAAVALAISAAIVAIVFTIGRTLFIATLSPKPVPANVAGVIYDSVAGGMRQTTAAILVLAIAVAIVAWLAGPFRTPRRLRGFVNSGADWVRTSAESHGLTTGRVGEFLYDQRILARVIIAIIAAVIVVFVRPLTPALIIWTLVIAVIIVAILTLIERPPTVLVVEETSAAAFVASDEADESEATAEEAEETAEEDAYPTSNI